MVSNTNISPNMKITPMLKQYLKIKKQYQKEVLFFRMGDFYEMFLDDAVYASKILDIVLTKRQDKIPMCGIPYHAFQNYAKKILKVGKNVAICEQVEDPSNASGKVLERQVVRVLTPGSIFEEELKDTWRNVYIAVVLENTVERHYGVLFAEISTGELMYETYLYQDFYNIMEKKFIKEFLILPNFSEKLISYNMENFVSKDYLGIPVEEQNALLCSAFSVQDIKELQFDNFQQKLYVQLFMYLKEIAPNLKIKWQYPYTKKTDVFMYISSSVDKTLELIEEQNKESKSSLFHLLNKSVTAHGKRFLEKSILNPLYNMQKIQKRLDTLEFFYDYPDICKNIRKHIKNCHDLDRIVNYLQNKSYIKYIIQIRESLENMKSVLQILHKVPEHIQNKMHLASINFPHKTYQLLDTSIVKEDVPAILDEKRLFTKGYHEELDKLIDLSTASQKYLKNFEQEERIKHKIPTIRIRYNNILGFFIEISKGRSGDAPKEYIKRQTLTNLERFTSSSLKKLENQIISAKEKVIQVQKMLFESLAERVLSDIDVLREISHFSAYLDFLCNIATVSYQNGYVKPIIKQEGELILKDSRHPVVEKLFQEEVFVPNDVYLNNIDRHLAILTGPNMSGKSTYIRQIGIIQIMAQMGCFVPCSYAEIPLVDKIFTRIGAYDMLTKGQSTFFVEMAECAEILKKYTKNSLILLDEVGRGTSTYDGISISRAILEHFNTNSIGKAKVLFATHYSELGSLVNKELGIIGLTMSILEDNNKIVFLRKIQEGIADKSYGVYVAKLAGVPHSIIEKANCYLNELENQGMWEKPETSTHKKTQQKQKKVLYSELF